MPLVLISLILIFNKITTLQKLVNKEQNRNNSLETIQMKPLTKKRKDYLS